MKKAFYAFACVLTLVTFSRGQISIPNVPFQYNQNFDTLGLVDVPWQNNQTIPGWHAIKTGGPVNTASANIFSLGELMNLGDMNDNNRSLGSTADAVNGIIYGAAFVNNSASIITNVNISFNGEQWFSRLSGPNTIQFFFRVGGADFLGNNVGWTPFTGLNFSSIFDNAGVVMFGHDNANKTNKNASINNISINPGENFWIRWFDTDEVGEDHALAIDELIVNFSGISTNVPNNPTNNIPGSSDITLALKKPKAAKTLRFKGANGFPIKGFIGSTTSTVTKASYAAFATATPPTNLAFTQAGIFKPLKKGKFFKQGFKIMFKSKANKAGIGIAPDTASVTLIVKLDSTQSTNITNSIYFTNTFPARVR